MADDQYLTVSEQLGIRKDHGEHSLTISAAALGRTHGVRDMSAVLGHIVIQFVLDLDHADRNTIRHTEGDKRCGRHVVRRSGLSRTQCIDKGEPLGDIFKRSKKGGSVDIFLTPVQVFVTEILHLIREVRGRKGQDQGVFRNEGDAGHRIGEVKFIDLKWCVRHVSDDEKSISVRIIFSAAPDKVRAVF